MIRLSHEIRPYPGCFTCKKRFYPYYFGDDKHYYCEDCARELVRTGQGEFGRHGQKMPMRCDDYRHKRVYAENADLQSQLTAALNEAETLRLALAGLVYAVDSDYPTDARLGSALLAAKAALEVKND